MTTIPYDNLGNQKYKIRIYGQDRIVKRVGNDSMSLWPGTLIFQDCTHPMQNVIVDESKIESWEPVTNP